MAVLDFSKAIYKALSDASALTTLVGTRIFPMIAPQGTAYPYLTYFIISDLPTHAMVSDVDLSSTRIQVSSWGASYSSADAVAKQVKTALQDYVGTVTVGADSLVIQRSFFEIRVDLSEHDADTMTDIYQVAQDFTMWAERK